jgi:hypothetical protein
MTWALLAGKVWGWLRAIPWQAWAIIAVLALWWWDRSGEYDRGREVERGQWEAAQRAADHAAEVAAKSRAEKSASIAQDAKQAAADAVTDARTETAKAVERVRYETRTIHVPADCPVTLPDSVRDEGRKAVERARAAQG